MDQFRPVRVLLPCERKKLEEERIEEEGAVLIREYDLKREINELRQKILDSTSDWPRDLLWSLGGVVGSLDHPIRDIHGNADTSLRLEKQSLMYVLELVQTLQNQVRSSHVENIT